MTQEPEVLIRVEGEVGRITLNRPQALHALTTNMCRGMIAALTAWRADPAVKLVLMDNSGERGFCAGGDIRMLAESARGDGKAAREFFFTEYRLNTLLNDYSKPLVAFIDGITMGGGVGLALPCEHRVATERTVFAMPETGIGLFPDVGGGWFLSRLAGKSGLWLALTGARIKAADCHYLGLATAVTSSADLPALKEALCREPLAIGEILKVAARSSEAAPLADLQDRIDDLFGRRSIEAIVDALAEDRDPWAVAQLQVLASKSPQSLKVAFRQLQCGRRINRFAENMAMEYRIGARVVQRPDFLEGVRAVIVDKDNAPKWDPNTLGGVTDAMLDAFFAALPPADEWTPLTETFP